MWWLLAIFLAYLLQIAAVVLIEYRRPYKAVTWLFIALAIPPIGFLTYCFVGKEFTCSNRSSPNFPQDAMDRLVERCEQRWRDLAGDAPSGIDFRVRRFMDRTTALPPTSGNETTVYSEGKQAFEAMLESISEAKHHIHIEFFIIRDDRLGTLLQRLLLRKAGEGVKIRLLYDGIGCRKLKKTYFKQLEAFGVETGCFFPPIASFIARRVNFRNHRKILVVDGKVGYFGGLNIGDEYLGEDPSIGHWRDTHFRVRGDAVLWIQYTFLQDWEMVKGQALHDPAYYPLQEKYGEDRVCIVKSGPNEPILELIFSCIASAKERIYIETPYFIPDAGLMLALRTAAKSGIDVRVIIPHVPDYRIVYYASLSFVEELLQAGVRFYGYRNGFIHAKVMICDRMAFSGTANMDVRSLCAQFEINAVFSDGNVVERLVRDFERDLGDSMEILLPEFRNRPRMQKLKEIFARLLSPLF
ncbi:cardiolipin synthase [Cohnella sp.]|uniref:cardiolipin synthase n=1 Tax=Cohnella sp. TaxID=1883426 RepID=UPI00356305A6